VLKCLVSTFAIPRRDILECLPEKHEMF